MAPRAARGRERTRGLPTPAAARLPSGGAGCSPCGSGRAAAPDEPEESSQNLPAYPKRSSGPREVRPSPGIRDELPALSSAICPGFGRKAAFCSAVSRKPCQHRLGKPGLSCPADAARSRGKITAPS